MDGLEQSPPCSFLLRLFFCRQRCLAPLVFLLFKKFLRYQLYELHEGTSRKELGGLGGLASSSLQPRRSKQVDHRRTPQRRRRPNSALKTKNAKSPMTGFQKAQSQTHKCAALILPVVSVSRFFNSRSSFCSSTVWKC